MPGPHLPRDEVQHGMDETLRFRVYNGRWSALKKMPGGHYRTVGRSRKATDAEVLMYDLHLWLGRANNRTDA